MQNHFTWRSREVNRMNKFRSLEFPELDKPFTACCDSKLVQSIHCHSSYTAFMSFNIEEKYQINIQGSFFTIPLLYKHNRSWKV